MIYELTMDYLILKNACKRALHTLEPVLPLRISTVPAENVNLARVIELAYEDRPCNCAALCVPQHVIYFDLMWMYDPDAITNVPSNFLLKLPKLLADLAKHQIGGLSE